eukprot:CAMPEP_0115569876 /NCGR_PEP_ID=MMETSP0271-20121206/105414_1 /TAXON_ID=71861 /ORGANISM="Scrippsiella trochoidea, Strain CCMP3099" /LENGTH=329 /DNA_ID=CAMNT_0003004405 /DNA_START=92 /DNA_END=1082 /DNA_ORIENTATION=-
MSSQILRRISSHLTFNFIFALMVNMVVGSRPCESRICAPPHAAAAADAAAAFATAQGLLLIFRTTAAYDRWWAGHRCVRLLRQHMQQIRRLSRQWMPPEDVQSVDALLNALPGSLEAFLSGEHGAGYLYGRDPRAILADIGEAVGRCGGNPDLTTIAVYTADRMQGHVTGALDVVEEMAQLTTVPVARNYSRHTSRFLSLWLLLLPFLLVDMGHFMPFAVVVVSWALLGIEEIGHAIEDPFNSPTDPVEVQEILELPAGWDPMADRRAALSRKRQEQPKGHEGDQTSSRFFFWLSLRQRWMSRTQKEALQGTSQADESAPRAAPAGSTR